MILYFFQIEELLEVIDKNQSVIGTDYKADFLKEEDHKILKKYGINVLQLYSKEKNSIFNYLNFWFLAEALRLSEGSLQTYDNLKTLIKKGAYLPTSSKEKAVIESISNQRFKELINYSEFELIKSIIIEGTKSKMLPQQISSDIGHKTGHWELINLVAYYQDIAWEEATVSEMKKKNLTIDPLVYKWVTKIGCCERCISLYLTDGLNSKPLLFKLSELEQNGSNESRIISQWKPTIYPTHIGCSCRIEELPVGYIWSQNEQAFSIPDPNYKIQTALKRKLIKVLINGKEHWL
jgi:hypothetical protein